MVDEDVTPHLICHTGTVSSAMRVTPHLPVTSQTMTSATAAAAAAAAAATDLWLHNERQCVTVTRLQNIYGVDRLSAEQILIQTAKELNASHSTATNGNSSTEEHHVPNHYQYRATYAYEHTTDKAGLDDDSSTALSASASNDNDNHPVKCTGRLSPPSAHAYARSAA
jgi:hypothetical protein